MSTTTTNLGLSVPVAGQQDWDTLMDDNLSKIDTSHGELSSFNKLNTATLTDATNPVADIANGRILYFPLTVSTSSCTLQNIAGMQDGEITVIVQQPAAGNCAFTWPALLQGCGDLSSTSGNLTGDTVSVQKFTYHSALGKAYASGPMVTGPK